MQMRSIEWRHSRRQLLLPIVVLCPISAPNPNLSMRIIGLLDTGATGSAFRPDVIDKLGLRRSGQRRVETANGLIFASEVLARIGFIPGNHSDPDFMPDQHQPYVLEEGVLAFELLPGFGHAALIGMDVIGQCDLTVRRDGSASMELP